MPIVLSASRRTDIPAFYLDWFFAGLGRGFFSLTNPYNGQVRTVAVDRDSVHSIVFWSKDYGPLLARLNELADYPAVFNYTLNTEDPLLEPSLLPLSQRLEQLRALAGIFGPRAVRWRFDPVVFCTLDGRPHDNIGGFEPLLDEASAAGLDTCTVSFMDPYRKIALREKSVPGLRFVFPGPDRLAEIASRMAGQAADRGIRLRTCCESALAGGGIANLEPGGCIDHELLCALYGGSLSFKPDQGQRRAAGCLCHESVDVGSYRGQPCRCGCLYCYANPVIRGRK
jgi:hypothetical protein